MMEREADDIFRDIGLSEDQITLIRNLAYKMEHDILVVTKKYQGLAVAAGIDKEAMSAQLLVVLISGLISFEAGGIRREIIDEAIAAQRLFHDTRLSSEKHAAH